VRCLPVFFAGLVFIRSFAPVAFGRALGSNLFGAPVGGLLELLSLVLVAALLYLAYYLTLRVREPAGKIWSQDQA